MARPFAPNGCRVTMGSPEENDQFLAAAREFAATRRRGRTSGAVADQGAARGESAS